MASGEMEMTVRLVVDPSVLEESVRRHEDALNRFAANLRKDQRRRELYYALGLFLSLCAFGLWVLIG